MTIRSGIRAGLVSTLLVGCNPSASEPGMLVALFGQSNAADNVDWSASDLGLGLGDTFDGFRVTRKIAGSDADPLVWAVDRERETLRPSSEGNPNMGPMLSAGRLAARHGVTEGVQFAISGCEIAKLLPDATYPTDGPNAFTQFVSMVETAEAASGTRFGILIFSQGETDADDETKAGLWQSRAQALLDELWTRWPDLVVVIPRINDSAVADHLETLIEGQDELAAANPGKVAIVVVDDLPMLDDFHYRVTEVTTIGNRTMAAGLRLAGVPPYVVQGPAPEYLGSDGAVYRGTSTTSIVVSSRRDLEAGDGEVLVVSKGYGTGTVSIADLRGFELVQEDTSDTGTGVTNYSAMYTRVVTQEMLDDPDFVWSISISIASVHANDKISANIDAYRSPSGLVTFGASAKSKNNALNTPVSCPGITTTEPDALVVNYTTGWCGNPGRTLSSIANASLAGLAQQKHSVLPVAGGEGMMISSIAGLKEAAGAVSATTATLNLYALQVNFTLEIQP